MSNMTRPELIAKRSGMKHLDLFSGIGGFALACDWAGIETIGFVEIGPFCQKVLKKHWPSVPIVEDINNVEEIKGIVANARLLGQTQRQEQTAGIEQGRLSEREVEAKSRLGKCCGITADTISRRTEQGHTATRESFSKFGCESITFTNTIVSDRQSGSTRENKRGMADEDKQALILTAGFPCQPFSNAGRKRGANDDRYLWPQTLAVIKAVKPDWVLLENVAGILNMVFPDSGVTLGEQTNIFQSEDDRAAGLGSGRREREYDTIIRAIMGDIEQAGYEATLLVIPACSLGAPHKRDRVWIIANRKRLGWSQGAGQRIQSSERITGRQESGNFNTETPDTFNNATELGYRKNNEIPTGRNGFISTNSRTITNPDRAGSGTPGSGIDGQLPQSESGGQSADATDPNNTAAARHGENGGGIYGEPEPERLDDSDRARQPDWQENWYEVATRFCRVDDGLPRIVDRVDRLKALGNAIVPQVAFQIIKGIQNANPSRFNS